jgi:phosphoenolpyruvate-protein kinase (PTS system EI component)/phosphotransferase system HPr-like phosphotransfer protein
LDKDGQAELRQSLANLGQVRVGTFVSLKDLNSTLCFTVDRVAGQDVRLQLNYIENKARYMIHARYAATMKALNDRFSQSGLTVSFKRSDEKRWKAVDIGQPLDLTELAIDTGEKYRIKVTGGDPETRQAALLDLWLAIKAEEKIDLEIEAAKKQGKDVKPPAIYEPNFIEIQEQQKFDGSIYKCGLTHFYAGKTESYHGQLVIWNFYKSFGKLSGLFEKKDVPISEINEIFEYMAVNYERRQKMETDDLKQQDWNKFIMMFAGIKGRLLKSIGDKKEIPIAELEKFFGEQLALQKGRNKENVEMMINYLVKGILNEEMENEPPKTDKPIILCAPSLTMTEAHDMPGNVICFLATELRDGSHPYEILNGKGIKTFTVKDEVADLINKDDNHPIEGSRPCSIVIGNMNLWLNIGLPENIQQNAFRLRKLANEEDIRALAFNWLPRRIIGGKKDVRIQATIRGYTENMKNEFQQRLPDGIGLYTTENSHIKADKILSEEEMLNDLNKLCELSKRVTMRLEDVSSNEDKIRRDEKPLPEIENKDNLSGAAFLLCEEGKERLLKPRLKAALEAHLKWQKEGREIRIMVPYVVNSDQIEQIRAILQECKDEVIQKHINPDMPQREVELMRGSLRIPLGAMLETKEIFTENAKPGGYNCENVARKSDFGSIGLNDLRYSFGEKEGEDIADASVFEPKVIKAINEAVKQHSKFSTSLSVCGKINGNREFLLLNVLGIEDFSVIFDDIRPFSESVRLFRQDELDAMKEKILKASTREEVENIIDAGQKHIDEKLKDQTINTTGTTGNILRSEAEEARLGRLRSAKIQALARIFNIIKDKETNKEERIISVLVEELRKDELLEIPQPKDITKWLSNELLIISFLDEWLIRNAIGVKCRGTPYIFHRSDDGVLWARAISRGGATGSMSRYYIEDGGTPIIDGKPVRMVKVNYFNEKGKETADTLCELKPTKVQDRFEVTLKAESQPEENIQLLARQENGHTHYYRKLAAEKLLVAKILNGEQLPPSDPSISYSKQEKVSAVIIYDRMRLSELKNIHIKDLKTSIDRDRKNMYYQPEKAEEINPYNINQVLFIKMRELNGNQSYVIVVDNWRENRAGYQPLLQDESHFKRITQFLEVEADEDEVLMNMILENRKLNRDNEKLSESEKKAVEKRRNLIMLQRKMLKLRKANGQTGPANQ